MRDGSHAIVWFRNDLRIADNPALGAAIEATEQVTALFVHEQDAELRPIGAAAAWWLHLSLDRLAADLAELGIPLVVETGTARTIVAERARRHAARAVFWNRRYSPGSRALDAEIKSGLGRLGIEVRSFNAALLVEPFEIATGTGTPYTVFTPFWRALRQRDIAPPLPRPKARQAAIPPPTAQLRERPIWARKLESHWAIGEAAAQRALLGFLDQRVDAYASGRDIPARDVTSRLSPHLRFGEIGPRQIWHAAHLHAAAHAPEGEAIERFLSEIAWREFSYHLLYHRADIATVPMQGKYAAMPWRDDPDALRMWRQGQTGIPIVDAGMRQLWATGWMHNRVRMLAASLLTKNLLLDWRLGEQWFWDTLVDADEANNPAGWQWAAGCGADAAPYFRIFNPVTQGEKFDPDGRYVRRWVPELQHLPNDWIHRPGEAPAAILQAARVALGAGYPRPLVDLKASRERALALFAAL